MKGRRIVNGCGDDKTIPVHEVSVIVPTLHGNRDGRIDRIEEELAHQEGVGFEFLVVEGIRPNGRARNVGAARARGSILVFIDDDVILGNKIVLRELTGPFRGDRRIGMAGTPILLPEDANLFQRWLAREIPYEVPRVDRLTVTNPDVGLRDAQGSCCAFSREAWDAIGGQDERLETGTDLDLRARIREAGFRVVLVPNTWVCHDIPRSFLRAARKWWWYGSGSAVARRVRPELLRAPRIDSWPKALAHLLLRTLLLPATVFVYRGDDGRLRSGLRPLRASGTYVRFLAYAVRSARLGRKGRC